MTFKMTFMLASTLSISGCMDSMHSMHNDQNRQFQKATYDSEGERLYFAGVSSSGDRMISIGGHHHMQMHGGSCVTCHGADKQGGTRMWPRFWVVAPALTPHALSSEHDDGHSHASYDENALKDAIVKGVNPEGEKLHETMPRWKMSESSLSALVHYLLPDDNHSH